MKVDGYNIGYRIASKTRLQLAVHLFIMIIIAAYPHSIRYSAGALSCRKFKNLQTALLCHFVQ